MKYLDSKDLKKIHKYMLLTLKEIDRICRKYSINYWIDGGTLLGAIRDNKFIPWDDDLDICMLRADYQIFLKIIDKELPENMYLSKSKKAIINKNCRLLRRKDQIKMNLSIDILPMDIFSKKRKKIDNIFYKKILSFIENRIYYEEKIFDFSSIIKFIVRFLLKLIDFNEKKLEIIKSHYFNQIKNKILKEDLYYSYSIGTPFTTEFDYEEIFPLQETELEKLKVFIPNNSDKYLKKLYGNYNELPPLEERISTHYEKVLD